MTIYDYQYLSCPAMRAVCAAAGCARLPATVSEGSRSSGAASHGPSKIVCGPRFFVLVFPGALVPIARAGKPAQNAARRSLTIHDRLPTESFAFRRVFTVDRPSLRDTTQTARTPQGTNHGIGSILNTRKHTPNPLERVESCSRPRTRHAIAPPALPQRRHCRRSPRQRR